MAQHRPPVPLRLTLDVAHLLPVRRLPLVPRRLRPEVPFRLQVPHRQAPKPDALPALAEPPVRRWIRAARA